VIVDLTARLAHYLDHLAPIWHALPEALRGEALVPEGLAAHARSLGIEPTCYRGDEPTWAEGGGPVLVAAVQDVRRAAKTSRPIALMAHGNGQGFVLPDGSRRKGYSGGPGFEAVALFLAVNQHQAALWQAAYPRAQIEVVGCPKLGHRERETGRRDGPVCISFHWPCQIGIPEAHNAWDHYRGVLADLAGRVELMAHAHPRGARRHRAEYARLGIPFLESFEQVLDTCSVYVNDASSTLYEFAAFAGPVVVLNSPTFRRDVEHGLRFWAMADVGPQVDHPRQLAAAVELALQDPPEMAARRRQISREVYPIDDPAGRASQAVMTLAGHSAPAATGG